MMNYALDALWWRLTQPHVRALASLLTAPALWHSGKELAIRELLGETGFRYLLQLDDHPEPLCHYLAQHAIGSHKLGYYAEYLLAFWFQHAPHSRLIAHNLPIISPTNQQTLGALDFVVQLNQQIYHIELTCKYYGNRMANAADMIGLNPQDRLLDKANKLTQQLAYLDYPAAEQALQAYGLTRDKIQSATIIRGMGFAAAQAVWQQKPLNPYGWHGIYLTDWAAYDWSSAYRYYLLPKTQYLAPARVSTAACHTATEIQSFTTGLIAVLEQRPDKHWHEISRLMKHTV